MRNIYIYLAIVAYIILGFYLYYVHLTKAKQQVKNTFEIDKSQQKFFYTEISNTWDNLIDDCGSSVMIENSAKANEVFNTKYFKRIVNWKGHFINAFANIPFMGMGINMEHFININVRMTPAESLSNPDLFMSLDAKGFGKFDPVLRTLHTGDAIRFKGSFESLGNEWRAHHFHLIEIEKIPEFLDHDKKILLYKGASFNITGHYKNNNELPGQIIEGENVKDLLQKIVDGNFTDSRNDTIKVDKDLELDETKINNSSNNTKLNMTVIASIIGNNSITALNGTNIVNNNSTNSNIQKPMNGTLKYLEEEVDNNTNNNGTKV